VFHTFTVAAYVAHYIGISMTVYGAVPIAALAAR
jgi:hypothetical protein